MPQGQSYWPECAKPQDQSLIVGKKYKTKRCAEKSQIEKKEKIDKLHSFINAPTKNILP